MSNELFVAWNVRCEQHNWEVVPGEEFCNKCLREQELLTMKPPFKVECLYDIKGLKKGSTYTVLYILNSGVTPLESGTGYLLETSTTNVPTDKIYDVLDFKVIETK